MTDVERIFVVNVTTDPDGLAVFRDREHAERFRDAMQAEGHEAILSEEPLVDGPTAEDMIAAASPPERPRFSVREHEDGWVVVDSTDGALHGPWETEELAQADAIVLNQGAHPEVISP